MADQIEIYRARTLQDYEACIELQREVWAFANAQDFAAVPLLLVGNRYGGSLLIAQESDTRILGFSFALLARQPDGRPFWWSHMTAVAQDRQDQGVGFKLKLAQRSEALACGIREIWWTFDPLQARNAHFNIRKLGAVAGDYEENIYGLSSSPLHHGLPTDRLLAKWQLESPRVVDRVGGLAPVILRDFDGLVRVFEIDDGRPGSPDLEHNETPLLVEIPLDFDALEGSETRLALRWQETLRRVCRHYFEQGYIISDFMVLEAPRQQALYVLEQRE